MAPKRKADSTVSPVRAKNKIDTSSKHAPLPKSARKPIVSKAKPTKKEAPAQSNTLFDFYPNLSKNAPLFRPSLAGDAPPAMKRSETDGTSVATDEYEIAMRQLEGVGGEADVGLLQPAVPTSVAVKGSAEHGGVFGPFSLDDDEDDRSVANQNCLSVGPTAASPVTGTESDQSASKSSESSLMNDTDDEKYATSMTDQIDEYRATADEGEEIDIEEERDRFENADDEENEDEAWSWQEYNAENFGEQRVSREESVLCPMCGQSIIGLTEHDRSAHVNRCLDLPPPSEAENQVDGKALVDATVVRENGLPKPCSPVKREESCASPTVRVKDEEMARELPRIKEEPRDDDEIEDFPKDENQVKVELSEVKDEFRDDQNPGLIKDEIEDVKPEFKRSVSNAFDKIMVNHSEEKQWADAARTENLQRGTKYKTRVCPFYKILSPFPIAVDAFKYGTVPGMEGYYLTHFHSDHYGGLSSTWDAGPIYCSSITGSLVIQQLRVRPEYVVKLPMDATTDVNGVKVTLIDANHCPGSTLFLFEGRVRGRDLRYLHCGDFRATPQQLLHPAVRGKKIDSLYLDTTYLSPKYAFPSQEDVIEACAHVCRDLAGLLPSGTENPVAEARNASAMSKFLNQKSAEAVIKSGDNDPTTTTTTGPKKPRSRLLVVVGTYSIGKERIVLGIAKALGSKIYAAQRKRDILSCLEDEDLLARLTSDPLEAQVHMTYLQEIRAETLADYLVQFKPHFGRIVGFRGTGWTYRPPKTRFLDSPSVEQILSWNPRYGFADMAPGRGSTGVAACYGVPYSEHSSFRELMCFCLSAQLGRVIPTVNVGSERSRVLMKAWLDRWAVEVRKVGVRPLRAGMLQWE